MNCDIIIPIGPGHEETYHRAVESVRIATLNKGPFNKVNVRLVDDTAGEMGRSRARNEGVERSDSEWMFFLDADDLMHPECFTNFPTAEYDAVFGKIMEYAHGCIVERYQVPLITSYRELIAFDPYQTLQMGHFVRRDVFVPFDEEMNCGEDWKYYLDLWKNHNCIKVPHPFMINIRGEHSVGPKSATGVEWSSVVREMVEEARNA